jgi:Xaa-Pro dipeptidase
MLQSKEEWAHPYQEGLPNSLFLENRAKFIADF